MEREKPKYERPMLIGLKSRVAEGAPPCQSGPTPSGRCKQGTTAGEECNAGGTATMACTGGTAPFAS